MGVSTTPKVSSDGLKATITPCPPVYNMISSRPRNGFHQSTPASQLSGEGHFTLQAILGAPHEALLHHTRSRCASWEPLVGGGLKLQERVSRRRLEGKGKKRSKRVEKKKVSRRNGKGRVEKKGKGRGRGRKGNDCPVSQKRQLLYHWSGNVTLWRSPLNTCKHCDWQRQDIRDGGSREEVVLCAKRLPLYGCLWPRSCIVWSLEYI